MLIICKSSRDNYELNKDLGLKLDCFFELHTFAQFLLKWNNISNIFGQIYISNKRVGLNKQVGKKIHLTRSTTGG